MQEWLETFADIDSAAERLRAIDEAQAAQPRTEGSLVVKANHPALNRLCDDNHARFVLGS